MKEEYRKNKQRVCEHAVKVWTDRSNGIYKWHEKTRYTIEYCLTQIQYFKNLSI